MNGAESLVQTLLDGGVDVCFTNPGTSEMHFCAALDRIDGMHCILCLFEGVVTGAADGYGRMLDRPAATLLHLGPGLGNGLANLHNAKKARTPIVNIVGEHATYHIEYDAPLTADIEGIAHPVSDWVRTSTDSARVASDAACAIAASRALRSGEPAMLLLGGRALRSVPRETAGRIAAGTGAELRSELMAARTERGSGRVSIERIPYPVDQAVGVLENVRHLILVGTVSPVAFFAYPDKPSLLAPSDCQIHSLAGPADDLLAALEWLADELGVSGVVPKLQAAQRPGLVSGALTVESIGSAIGHLLPENAIICDESVTSGRGLHPFTRGCAPHDWLSGTGGAIGRGLPEATGAAVACPDRPVLCLSGDGSAMYTVQALWTQARENLDVTTVIFSNRSYAILHGELRNVGATPGPKAHDMFDLDRPNLDWTALAKGMGVEAVRVDTAEQFNKALEAAFATQGPMLIEAVI